MLTRSLLLLAVIASGSTPKTETLSLGETFSFPITATRPAFSGTFELTFSPGLQYSGLTQPKIGEGCTVLQKASEAGVRIVLACSSAIMPGTGPDGNVLLYIKFKTTKIGQSTVNLSYCEIDESSCPKDVRSIFVK